MRIDSSSDKPTGEDIRRLFEILRDVCRHGGFEFESALSGLAAASLTLPVSETEEQISQLFTLTRDLCLKHGLKFEAQVADIGAVSLNDPKELERLLNRGYAN